MGILTTAENAIVTALATVQITCKTYEPKQIVPPVATLWITRPDPGYTDDYDHVYGIGECEWILRYYVRLMQNEKVAYDAMRTAIENIYIALGANREIGANSGIRSHSLSDCQMYAATDGEQPLLVFEARLSAVLRPNIGA